ncbi:hypothetical protein JZO76_07255 [Enterococcus sp. MJM12]|uniref:DUF1642 domain-containing protein n=1 Tax=Candidatus Enterococcus myersii TaxID=2815322 RepID=A0ABS3H7B0_9ENTE|nr:hypothetical protein [Enterococcus sp. MJM12]MBO0449336.1 hypothetical protein [Enterococcus sp. MJM12]
MNKQEFIEKLKMHGAWCTDCHDINGEKDRYVKFAKVRELLEQIDEPQAEKVEVPPMIDKFIKDHTDPIFEICAWSDHYGNDGRTCDDPELSVVLDWYGNNTTEFYEAVVNGYTVKSKRWVVKKGKDCVLTSFTFFDEKIVNYDSNSYGKNYIYFTDKSKAEAVATLVEGSVEEI